MSEKLLENLKDFIAPNCLQDVRVMIEDAFREFKLNQDACYEDLLSRVKLMDSIDLGLPTLRGNDISDDIHEESPKRHSKAVSFLDWEATFGNKYKSHHTLNRELDEYYETPCIDVTCQCYRPRLELNSQVSYQE